MRIFSGVGAYLKLLDRLGCARGLIVQGNAHGYDNRVLLDALARLSLISAWLRRPCWHRIGMRGLRFHLLQQKPSYVRAVGFDVFEAFRRSMADLGWVAQFFCDYRILAPAEETLRAISREMPVIVDHYGMIDVARGPDEENFQALLRLVGERHAHVKLLAPYRISARYPDYPDARPPTRRWCAPIRSDCCGDRLAASVDCGRGHAGRRPSARPVPRLDAGSASRRCILVETPVDCSAIRPLR
jgi:predicted TIM-barrel fold metal-dependent hydrolase